MRDGVAGGADVDPVPGCGRDAFIPGGVKPAVAFDDAKARVLEFGADQVEGAIGRAAIDDDDFQRQACPCLHGWEVCGEQIAAIIGRHYHADGWTNRHGDGRMEIEAA